jgi:hypothetical protein
MSNNKPVKSLDNIIQNNRQNQKAITVIKKEGGSGQAVAQGSVVKTRKTWVRRRNQNRDNGKQTTRGNARRGKAPARGQNTRDSKVCYLI